MDANEAIKLVNRIYARLANRRGDIEKREEYYQGKQPLTFASEEWKKANQNRYVNFSDNWCAPVVNAEAERIAVTGIKITDFEDDARALYDQWMMNEMEAQSSQGFVTTLATSTSFVIVWGDENNEPSIEWQHPGSVEIEYDWANPRIRRAALKTWLDEEWEYATLYTPDAVWKYRRSRREYQQARDSQPKQSKQYASDTGSWVAREIPGETWPVPNPLGEVPVVEIPNRPTLKGDPVSEIAGVIPMQDAINLLWVYLFVAADFASMPARVVMGQHPPKIPILDEKGEKVGERALDMDQLAQKRIAWLTGENTKIGQWDAAKLDVFTDVISMSVGHIASQTRTPPTYLITTAGMSNVSADGLKAAEIGLTKKVQEFQTFASPQIREVFRLVAKVQGKDELAKRVRLATITWKNPEIRSEAQLADALLKKKQLGYPLEYLMELDGLDPQQIERVLSMAAAEQLDPQLEAANRELNNIANTGSSQ